VIGLKPLFPALDATLGAVKDYAQCSERSVLMYKRIAFLMLATGVLTTGVAFSQAPSNPTQQTISAAQGTVPIFRITVVGRTTSAINYRPRRGDTKVDFAGTPLLPQARGNATVSGEKGYIKIDARFDKLEPAQKFGREYLTYVLWAITPEGRATNLGEIQVDDDDARVQVTTELQSFGMIVTAEPYFAVTQPSDVVVIENVVRDGTQGSVEVIQAKHELLKRGSYLMNQDAARYSIKPLEPGAPLDLAEARNAVALARLAGADRFATETFDKAARLLASAEEARTARRGANAIMMPARQAAQTAEDARLIGLQKQEDAFQGEQRAIVLAREKDALDRAQSEAARRRQAEFDAQTAAAGRAAAERQTADAEAARLAAERGRATDADAARLAAETARAQAEAARLAAEARAQSAAQNAAAQSEQEKAALRERLRTQLNVILETRETARGLIVSLSDVLFDTGSANLKAGAREKLARISGILVSHQGLKLEVEGHTDSVGADDYNQRLSEQRAGSVSAYLGQQGIAPAAVGTAGFGESKPVATNDTAAGRQQNRRVELVVSGDVIGRR
jgi:outer membrane protein OmpA-like peptidoglycan-associated protein